MSFDVNLDSCTYIIPEAIKRNCDLFDFNSYRIYSNYIETEDNDNLKVIQNGYFRTDTTCLIWRNIPFGIVTWLCHGNSRGASGVILSGQSGNQYASSLSDNYPSLIFQGACWNASPDDSLNLAYSLLKHQAVGTIAATRPANGVSKYDSVNISNGFETSHWNYWFTKLLMNNNISIGQTLINLKSQFPSSFDGQWVNILGFNLYGDPSLKLNSTVNTILLKNGWNFISSYLLPDRNSLKSMFWYIKNYIGSIKNQNDDVFIPDSIDEIGNWNNQKAYKIYMNTSAYFYIAGSKINPVLDTIPLNSGWNWVSYLRNSNMSIDTAYALNSIKNNLLMAKSGSGLIYVPEFHINQIGNMLPNQGYEISVNADCNLVYPQDSTSYNYKAVLDETSILSPVAKKLTPFVTNTGNDCTLIFDKLNIPDGYEIGIVNGDGILIGAGAIQNRVCALTVWGKDILNNTEGAIKGEELFAFTIDTTNNRIQEVKITNIQDFLTKENLNSLTYEKRKIYVCNANAELTAINENMYITNQPNPFNDQTEITYKIPEAGNVVVNISSIHGEIVATYNQGNQEAGIYNILFDGSNLLGGVYVLDLIFENERVQSIMILIK